MLPLFVAVDLQEQKCIRDLKEYLLDVCPDKSTKKQLRSLLEEKASSVGLLVCRRFVNFPYELVPKLYDALFDEVSWATEDEVILCSEAHYFLYIFTWIMNLQLRLHGLSQHKNSRTPSGSSTTC